MCARRTFFMKSVHVSRVLLAAVFVLGLTPLAPAPADAEECYKATYKTSPIKAGKYEYLACSVLSNVEGLIEVQIELEDEYGDDVVEEEFELWNQEFATLAYKVPDYTGLEAVCQVKVWACFNDIQASAANGNNEVEEYPKVKGNLKRRSTNGRQDFASSELELLKVKRLEPSGG
jgi:hypothetical protein